MSKEREPLGLRIAEISKKIDVIQIGVGIGFLFFNPAVGGVIIVGSAITYFAASEYQKRRRSQQQLAAAGG